MASVPQPAPAPATPVTRPAAGRNPLRKAALDRSLAALGMVLSSPIVLAAGAAIRLEDGPPVFFSQERAGRHGTPFQVWKFRSMRLRSGFVPNVLGLNLTNHLGEDTTLKVRLAFWATIESESSVPTLTPSSPIRRKSQSTAPLVPWISKP